MKKFRKLSLVLLFIVLVTFNQGVTINASTLAGSNNVTTVREGWFDWLGDIFGGGTTLTRTYNITKVTNPAAISVNFNTPRTQLTLPSTISVVTDFYRSDSVSVTWNTASATYTPYIPGTYTFTGTIVETNSIKNPYGYTVSVNVSVGQPSIPSSPSYIENIDPNPYTSLNVSNGTVLYEFDSSSEWLDNTQATVTLDTSNYSSGSGSIFIQPNVPIDIAGAGVSYYTLQGNLNLGTQLKDNKVIEINIYKPMSTDVSYMLLRFHTDTSGYSFYETAIGLWELSPGWNKIRRTVDDFTYVNWADSTLTATWDTITTMDFVVAYPTGGTGTIGLDKVAVNPQGKARILFTFDDAWQDVYDKAYPILEAKGFDATTWVIKDAVVESWNSELSASMDYMGVTELNTLYASGWDLGNHTNSHPDSIAGYTDTQLFTLYGETMNWLIDQGWERGAYHVCYPSGQFNDHLISLLQALGTKTGRTTVHGMEPVNVSNIYKLKTVAVGRDSQIQQYVIGGIDDAVATGSTIIFMFHRVEDSPEPASDFPTGDDYGNIAVSTSTFQYIVDYVDSYVQQGSAEVVTISEWYNEYMTGDQSTAPVTPSPTPQPTPEPTSPVVSGSTYTLVNANSSKVLDVNGGDLNDGGNIIQWTAHGGTNQDWVINEVSDGIYTLTNVNSGKLLDVYGAGTADGTNVIQWYNNGGSNQLWQIVDNGNNTYSLINVNSGKALAVDGNSTADGANILQWTIDGSAGQAWTFVAK